MINKILKLGKKKIKINKKVFYPTGTSKILIETSLKKIKNKNKKILDIGCGSGIVGINIAKKLNIKSKIYFSDISELACKNTLYNCKKFNINSEIKCGDNLKPWKNDKFHFIISDIAAIAEDISVRSSWYKSCENNSGYDGTNHVIQLIKNAKNNLYKSGMLIFPIISLSNQKKILYNLKKNFKNCKIINSQVWPMPKELSKNKKLLNNLKKRGTIDFNNIMGLLTFKTDIYCAKK